MTSAVTDPAASLDAAQHDARAIDQLPEGIGVDEAYLIQRAVLSCRLDRGEQLVGTKLGFTSKAKMAQMGVSEVIVGQLTDAMRVADGGDVALSRFIHPRIEPEIAFRLDRDVDLADPTTDLRACVDAVAPALEIIDSRYREFRFSLPDVIADNTSAAAFVIGPWSSMTAVGNRAVRLIVDGRAAEIGSTAAILGHPTRALDALARIARRHGFLLLAGHIVLAGAATAAVAFGSSVVEARVAGLGSASVRGINA